MVIFSHLPVVPQDADLLLQLGVAGYNCAGLTKCPKIFSGVETETAGIAKRTGPSSLVFGSMSLASFLNDKQTTRAREFQDGIHVGGLTKKVDWNDRLRPGGNSALQSPRI